MKSKEVYSRIPLEQANWFVEVENAHRLTTPKGFID